MSTWCRMLVSVCLLAEMEASTAVGATGGRIVFTGAVVRPTCRAATVIPSRERPGLSSHWRPCTPDARSAAGSSRRANPVHFRVRVIPWSPARSARQPVWRYLHRHGRMPARVTVREVVRTYQ